MPFTNTTVSLSGIYLTTALLKQINLIKSPDGVTISTGKVDDLRQGDTNLSEFLLICLLYCSFLRYIDTIQEFPDILVLDRSGLLDQGSCRQSKTISTKQQVQDNS